MKWFVFIKKVRNRIFGFHFKKDVKKYGGIRNISTNEADSILSESIIEKKECSVIRVGMAELLFFYEYENKRNKLTSKYKNNSMAEIFNWDSYQIKNYIELLKNSYRNADIIVSWYNFPEEEWIMKQFANKKAFSTSTLLVAPFFMENSWLKSLRGKKVLVISPFSETIKRQYIYRDKLFSREVLPEFELKVLKSVWFCGKAGNDERFATWFDAYDYLKNEIKKIDFDIALLGCGPFGTPLVNEIKKMGKQAVYIGGHLQILFGIKGKRWDSNKMFSDLYNEWWVRPDKEERPENPKQIEDGCYW